MVPFVFDFGTPSAGKFRSSVSGPGPGFLSEPRAVLGQNGPKSSYFMFSRHRGSGPSKRKLQGKLRTTIPDGTVPFFFRFRIPVLGNCGFLLLAQARNCSGGPKRAKIPLNHRFRPRGDPTGEKVVPEKVAEHHPGWRGTIFFRFRDPCCSGAQKGPCRAACLLTCLLAARRVSSTLVP